MSGTDNTSGSNKHALFSNPPNPPAAPQTPSPRTGQPQSAAQPQNTGVHDLFSRPNPQPAASPAPPPQAPTPRPNSFVQAQRTPALPAPPQNRFNWASPHLRAAMILCTVLLLLIPVLSRLSALTTPDKPTPPLAPPPVAWAVSHPEGARQMQAALQKMQAMKTWIQQRYSDVENRDPSSTSLNNYVSKTLGDIPTSDCPPEFQKAFLAHEHAWENFETSESNLLEFKKRSGAPLTRLWTFARTAVDVVVRNPSNPEDDVSNEEMGYRQQFTDSSILVNKTRQNAEDAALEFGVTTQGVTK
ncbi:MAG: hypothetical protein JWL77_4872 [Chthonomonadaceae bacterium]|nr:hypothetical protein [Chthonomonadaceae bacterium]